MVALGCGPQQAAQVSQAPASSTADLMKARGLSEAALSAALQTYIPTGKKDDYITFASGGHGGHTIVIGVPSMRILKYVGVFTPEPWQGYGHGDNIPYELRRLNSQLESTYLSSSSFVAGSRSPCSTRSAPGSR